MGKSFYFSSTGSGFVTNNSVNCLASPFWVQGNMPISNTGFLVPVAGYIKEAWLQSNSSGKSVTAKLNGVNAYSFSINGSSNTYYVEANVSVSPGDLLEYEYSPGTTLFQSGIVFENEPQSKIWSRSTQSNSTVFGISLSYQQYGTRVPGKLKYFGARVNGATGTAAVVLNGVNVSSISLGTGIASNTTEVTIPVGSNVSIQTSTTVNVGSFSYGIVNDDGNKVDWSSDQYDSNQYELFPNIFRHSINEAVTTHARLFLPFSIKLSNFRMRVSTNNRTDTTYLGLNINGSPSKSLLVVGGGVTGLIEDTVNEEIIPENSYLSYHNPLTSNQISNSSLAFAAYPAFTYEAYDVDFHNLNPGNFYVSTPLYENGAPMILSTPESGFHHPSFYSPFMNVESFNGNELGQNVASMLIAENVIVQTFDCAVGIANTPFVNTSVDSTYAFKKSDDLTINNVQTISVMEIVQPFSGYKKGT